MMSQHVTINYNSKPSILLIYTALCVRVRFNIYDTNAITAILFFRKHYDNVPFPGA